VTSRRVRRTPPHPPSSRSERSRRWVGRSATCSPRRPLWRSATQLCYEPTFEFTGGTIETVVFDIADDAYVDVERHFAAMARD
jgi:hypothetical protein